MTPSTIRRATKSLRFDWTLRYPSRRQPILARNVVATSQPLATQAGIAMLQRGGNAVDAALATAIALTVVEPCSNGIGSDLFAIVWDGRALAGLNASGRAPAAVTAARYAGATAHAAARLGSGDDSRRGLGLGRAVAALRRPALRRSVRAGDPLRARRLRRVAGHRREMGARDDRAAARSGLRRALHAARPRAAAGRDVRLSRDGGHARKDRRDARQRVLSRRARAGDGRRREAARRRARARRFRRRTRSTG